MRNDCPVCESTALTTLRSFTSEEAAGAFLVEAAVPERFAELVASVRRLWGQDSCAISRCGRCAFGFSNPYVAGDEEFYRLAFPREGYPKDKFEFRKSLEVLEGISLTGPVLEIGAGPGHFLEKIAPSRIAPDKAVAVEFAPANIARMKALGFTTIQGDFRDVVSDDARFEAIFMFQALEHLDGIDAVFRKFGEILLPDGHLFIAVPNPDLVDFDESHGSLQDMPPNHIGRWRLDSFRAAAERYGYSVIDSAVPAYSVKGFIKHDVYFSYRRAVQNKGTLAHWARARRSGRFGAALGVAAMSVNSLARIPAWIEGIPRRAELGGCLWVYLQKHG
jgi:SAM-dependent methyltransferase